MEIEHLGARDDGANIRASASVTGSSELKFIFEVEIHDGSQLVAHRITLDFPRILSLVYSRSNNQQTNPFDRSWGSRL